MQKKYFSVPYIITYLCAFVLGLKQLREPDVWWQLLTGEWMLENGQVTKTDPFSYTMEGTSWVNVKWLYEVIIAFLEKGFGPHGVLLLQGLINVVIVYLLLRVLGMITKHLNEKASTFYSVVAVIIFLALSEFRMAGRPEMVSHLMSVVYLFILWRSPKFEWKQVLPLVLLQCLWANMHEGYPVGLVIIGLYIAGSFISYLLSKEKEHLQSAIRLGIIFVAAALAILLNPNTIQLWKQPFEIYRQLGANKYTSELFSFTEPRYWTIQAKVHVALLVAVMLYWGMMLLNYKKGVKKLNMSPLFVGYLLSIPVLGYLSLTANRNIPFAQIALLPSIPMMIDWIVDKLKLREKAFYQQAIKKSVLISSFVGAMFYMSIVSNAYYKFTESPNRYGAHISMLHNPTGASEFMQRHGIKGVGFSDYFVSSYLLWDQYPDFKSYIDLRDLDIFPSEFFDDYFELYNNPKKFYELDSTYKFNYVVLSTSQLTPMQQMLYWNQGFNVVYVDPVSVIFLRESDENKHINENVKMQKLFTWPQEPVDPAWAEAVTKLLNPTISFDEESSELSPMHAARYYNMVRNYNVAKKLLKPAIDYELAENSEALTTLGYTYLDIGNYERDPKVRSSKLDTSLIYLQRALDIDDKNSKTHMAYASINVMRQNYEVARTHLEKTVQLDPFNDYAYYVYGVCVRNLWNRSKSNEDLELYVKNMERALELNEGNEKAHLYLAEGYWSMNKRNEARKHMEVVIGTDMGWAHYEKDMIASLKRQMGMN